MPKQRKVAILIVIFLVVGVSGIWGTWVMFQSTSAPPMMPTLAHVDDASGDVLESQPAIPVQSVRQNAPPENSTSTQPIDAILTQVDGPQQQVIDQFVLEFPESMTTDDILDYVESLDVEVVETITDLHRVVIKSDANTVDQLSLDVILSTEPDYYASALLTLPPTDPYYDMQWTMDMIGAPIAWEQLPSSPSAIRVAVIDSGACFDHPDMQGIYTDFQYDYVDNDDIPQDTFGHGCTVTGVLASQNNNIGIIGVAPFVEIMPLRVLDENGSGIYSNIAQAIVDATHQGAQILNLSLGGYSNSSTLRSAVEFALANDVYIVAATGNNGLSTPLYPARLNGVIGVGSVNQNGDISAFSNRGEDTLAPGEGVFAPYNNDYFNQSGTSLAVPHLSGVIALELALGREPVIDSGVISVQPIALPIEEPTPSPTAVPEVIIKNGQIIPYVQTPEPVMTDRWVVRLENGTDADIVADQLGFQNLGQVGTLEGYYVFAQVGTGESKALALSAEQALSASTPVLEFHQEVALHREFQAVPTDPLVTEQWHLINTGQSGGTAGVDINITDIWNEGFDGSGVTVAIVDSGLEYTHPDFVSKYNASASYDYNGTDTGSTLDEDNDPFPEIPTENHGTSVGGVAAADDDGSKCGVGVAFNADISGLRLLGDGHAFTDSQEADAFTYANQINDIYNNSWGIAGTGFFLGGPGPLASAALEDGVLNGRGGLGSIYVFAAGNGGQNFDHSNADGYPSSRYTIAVSATDDNGLLSNYSEIGTSVLVNAPSNPTSTSDPTLDPEGIVTTDRTGTAGYNNLMGFSEDCTDNFGGTSSATPVVSGVIALMLQANPNLTWRDVQHILVESSSKNDPASGLWNTNGAGRDYNIFYGFGTVDATAAVNLAKTWVNAKPEISLDSGIIPSIANIPDAGAPVDFQYIESENITIESVEIYWDADHAYRGDLQFTLTSPSGTDSLIYLARISDAFNGSFVWTTTSMEFWGEESAGTWTLSVQDVFNGDFGQMNAFAIKFNGTQGEYRVTTTVDENNGCSTGNCSLREAIIAANAYGDGPRVIIPADTYTLTIPGTGEDAAATGDLDITANIHIIGAGRDQTIIDANQIDRVFDVFSNSKIEYLTVTGGQPENGADGGGIRLNPDTIVPVGEKVEVNGVILINNATSNGDGGAMAMVGTNDDSSYELLLSYSIIENNSAVNGGGLAFIENARGFISETEINNNQATNFGGGIFSDINGNVVQIRATTLSNNTAQSGGGSYFDGTGTSIFNTTISGNSATEDGGGLYYTDTSGGFIFGLTLTENIADSDSSSTGYGGGLVVDRTTQNFTLDIADSIIADNTDNSGTAPDCHSGDYGIGSYSRNLIGDTTSCLLDLAAIPLYNNYDFLNVDPLLASLADNGGYTPTHALPSNSPAIDKVTEQSCRDIIGHDQRGIPRNLDMICDLGAFEYDASLTLPIKPEIVAVAYLTGAAINEHPNAFFTFGTDIYRHYVPISESPSGLALRFNKSVHDALGDSQLIDATNPSNYLLLRDGTNNSFDTITCGTIQGDDVVVTIDSLWHTQAYNNIFLNLNGGTALSSDSYRLVACNLIDQENNLMDDFVYDFIVGDTFTLGIELEPTSPATVHTLEEIHEYDTAQDHIDAHFSHSANNPAGDSDANDVTNPNNYRVITSGTDGIFQTNSCVVQGDDQQLGIDFVTYFPTDSRATVNLTSPLIDGIYRFIACDDLEDTSNQSLDGNKDGIDGGDYVSQFIVFPKPTNVTGTSNLGQVTLMWDDLADSETGFAIERRENISGTGWAEVGIAAINATAFVDFSAHCDTEYIYRVQTRRDTDMVRSGYSDEVIVNNGCSSNLFIVNSTADTNDGVCDVVSCSLREAIIAANAFGDGAIVSIPADTYTLSIPGTGEDAAATGDLDITADIHIIGAGRDQTIIDANQIDRVFDVFSASKIEHVTIQNGLPENGTNGGGIRVNEDTIIPVGEFIELNNLNINNNIAPEDGGGIAVVSGGFNVLVSTSVIEENSADSGGGIVMINNNIYIHETEIRNNQASDLGGGIFGNAPNGINFINSSTISNNTARVGGGSYFKLNSSIILFNSTYSGNSATGSGGGIYFSDTASISAFGATFTENIADSDSSGSGAGGGLAISTAIDTNIGFSDSIIAGNTDSGIGPDCYSNLHSLLSYGRNLIGDSTGCFVTTTNIDGFYSYEFFNVDPLLGGLADNGGYTTTHALAPNSPAIDKTPSQSCRDIPRHDQRGVKRDIDMICDLGAFEHDASVTLPIAPQVVSVGYDRFGPITEHPFPNFDYGIDIYNNYLNVNEEPNVVTLNFNKSLDDPLGNNQPNDVTNLSNYRLVTDGTNGVFDTNTCGLAQGDDTAVSVDSLWHTQAYNTVFLNLNGGTALSTDTYRLIVCNLVDQDGNVMDANFVYDLTINDTFIGSVAIADPTDSVINTLEEIHEYDVIYDAVYAVFNRDAANPAGDSDADDVTNPNNYRFVIPGTDDIFQTDSCSVQGDDQLIPITDISYFSDAFEQYATVNLTSSLVDGNYRFVICDDLEDTFNQSLDGDKDGIDGGDYVSEFVVFPKPTNIIGTMNAGFFMLSWDDRAETETGYVIERREGVISGGWNAISSTKAEVNNFVDTTISCDEQFAYRVQAHRDSDKMRSGYSNEVTQIINCTTITEPNNLIATPVSGTQIDLTWNDNNYGIETAYRIERRELGGIFAEISEVPGNSTSYSDPTVICGLSYEYQVRAYRLYDDAYSDYSNIASADTPCPPPAPSSLVVNTVIGFEQLDLIWVDNSNNETEFRIERSTTGAGTWTLIDTVAADATTYSDIDVALACYTAYDYRVIAFRAGDSASSLPSNTATGTTSCTTVIAPTNLSVTLNETTTDLIWTDNSPDEDNFQIQRADASVNNWATLGTSPANLPTFNDATTTCGNSYDYRVRAQRNGVDSDFSNVFTIQQTCPPPSAPSDLTLTGLPFSNDIQLDWVDNAVSETVFYIERSVDGVSGWTQIVALGENVVTYTDTDASLDCYTPYYYQVLAYRSDDGVFSDYSSIVNTSTWCGPDLVASQVFTVNAPTSDVSAVTGFPAPSCAPNMNHATVWEFLSTTPQALSLTTFGSPFDTVMSIWRFDGTSYVEIACNDNAAMDGTSALVYTFPASPRHMLIVGGKNNTSGTITLNSSQIVPPTATPVPTNTPVPTATDTPNLTTVGLFQNGLWLFRDSNTTGVTDVVIRFGQQLGSGWQPLIGDWDGDGVDGIGLYKDGRWLLRDGADNQIIFGAIEGGWQPVVGDWDGDGDDGVGLYKNGIWMLKNDPSGGNADYTFRFNVNGSSTAKAIAGDWHDESKDRVGLYDNGRWFLSYSHQTDNNAKIFDFGPNDSSWMPVIGDWDKDGDDTIGVYKETGWRLRNSNSRGYPDLGFTFGLLDAIPVAGYRGEAGGLALLAIMSDDTSISDAPTLTATAITIEPTDDSTTHIPILTATVTSVSTVTPTPTLIPTQTLTALPTATATMTSLPTATEEPPSIPENVSGS